MRALSFSGTTDAMVHSVLLSFATKIGMPNCSWSLPDSMNM